MNLWRQIDSACYWLNRETKERLFNKLKNCKFAEERLEMYLATWSLKLPELDRGRLPIGPSGLRAIEPRDTRDCRNRDNQIFSIHRENHCSHCVQFFTKSAITKQYCCIFNRHIGICQGIFLCPRLQNLLIAYARTWRLNN